MPDDATRRLLRFSLFLQGFAGLMMGGALAIRASVIGWDAVTFVLAGAVAVIGCAIAFTARRLRYG